MSFGQRFLDLHQPDLKHFYTLYFKETPIGWVHENYLEQIKPFSDLFVEHKSSQNIHFTEHFEKLSFDARTAALDLFSLSLRDLGIIKNWRNEYYGIYQDHNFNQPLFAIERGVVPFLGLKAYGVHVNAFTYKEDALYMWIARRAASRVVEPLKYDQIAAGGLPFGVTVFNNVLKECEEEASIPNALAKTAKSAGKISYLTHDEFGLRNDTLFCFDLELPPSFIPAINDGEVDEFLLLPINEIINLVKQPNQFKTNSALVVIQFLINHRFIDQNSEEYSALEKALFESQILMKMAMPINSKARLPS